MRKCPFSIAIELTLAAIVNVWERCSLVFFKIYSKRHSLRWRKSCLFTNCVLIVSFSICIVTLFFFLDCNRIPRCWTTKRWVKLMPMESRKSVCPRMITSYRLVAKNTKTFILERKSYWLRFRDNAPSFGNPWLKSKNISFNWRRSVKIWLYLNFPQCRYTKSWNTWRKLRLTKHQLQYQHHHHHHQHHHQNHHYRLHVQNQSDWNWKVSNLF